MTKEIKAAHAEVSNHKFGTQEWEAAMVVVRKLVDEQNSAAPKFTHTSVDGDVWSV